METTLRNADLNDLVDLLREQQDIKYDVVVPAHTLRYSSGNLIIKEGRVEDIGGSQVTGEPYLVLGDAVLRPMAEAEKNLADRLDIPYRYIERMRLTSELALLDHNVNTWLEREKRNWLVRGFLTDSGEGVARAFLSDSYRIVDHLDALMAALAGIKEAGVRAEVTGGNLSPSQMWVTVEAPEITAMAPHFMRGYNSPDGGSGTDNPVISAGLQITNSETGKAAFAIAPRLVIQVCKNGLTRTVDALRKVHLGEKLMPGPIVWSEATYELNLSLIRAQVTDTVRSFLSVEYVEGVAAELEARAGHRLADPVAVVKQVTGQLGFTQVEQDDILSFFVAGGQVTAGGVMQAATAYAQVLQSPDRAAEIEAMAFDILALAVAS